MCEVAVLAVLVACGRGVLAALAILAAYRRGALAAFAILAALAACSRGAPAAVVEPQRGPIALTYLGVAGWQLESNGATVIADPYFTRPDLSGVIASDPKAVAARAPKQADLIVVGHSHVDHLLDAAPTALASGAQVLGSESTAKVVREAGVPPDRVITAKGGEDFQFDRFSVRVIPSLHSMLDHKHTFGAPITVLPPTRFEDFQEGGTFIYLVRIGGHEVFVQSTANFIERELEGLHPDIAIIATGLREEVHDYTCRLMRVLGYPPIVYANHFDAWKEPPVDAEASDDLRAFVDEVHRCAPSTSVVIPKHFARMTR